MKIAKEFRWEMGHRLTFHEGLCINLHGHSYKMLVEVDGDLDKNGMVIDYFDLKTVVGPIIDELDHSFMVKNTDSDVLEFLQKMNMKHVVVDTESTAENLCFYMLKRIENAGLPENINSVMVKVFETENTYAQAEQKLK